MVSTIFDLDCKLRTLEYYKAGIFSDGKLKQGTPLTVKCLFLLRTSLPQTSLVRTSPTSFLPRTDQIDLGNRSEWVLVKITTKKKTTKMWHVQIRFMAVGNNDCRQCGLIVDVHALWRTYSPLCRWHQYFRVFHKD